jgi:hypothetical protein
MYAQVVTKKKTQKTSKEHDIPVPKRKEFVRNLKKAAKAKPSTPRRYHAISLGPLPSFSSPEHLFYHRRQAVPSLSPGASIRPVGRPHSLSVYPLPIRCQSPASPPSPGGSSCASVASGSDSLWSSVATSRSSSSYRFAVFRTWLPRTLNPS